ncbi:MAG: hypothetical protein U0354_01050 [Candidatus Sericytochromatia bacterium]
MKLKKRPKGQSMVEYAIIMSVIILGLIVVSKGLSLGMRGQVESTAKGLSSESHLKNK